MAVADVRDLVPALPAARHPAVAEGHRGDQSAKLALEGLGALFAPVLVSALGVRGALVAAAVPLPVVVVAGWKMLHRLDATAGDRTRTLGLLHGVSCLEPLDMPALESLAGGVVGSPCPPGLTSSARETRATASMWSRPGPQTCSWTASASGSVAPGGGFGERALLRDSALHGNDPRPRADAAARAARERTS